MEQKDSYEVTWGGGHFRRCAVFFGLRPLGRRGPGWRGRRESDSQAFCHHFVARMRVYG